MVMRNRNTSTEVVDDDEAVAEIPLEKRPFVSLTPKSDGHWLNLSIINVMVDGAATLDYELIYETKEGNTQGVPGTIDLSEGGAIERDLLLGSESSGKFRYDEGVEEGQLTLRFRNSAGKLVGKLSTDWHMQTNVTDLSTVDGDFAFKLDKAQKAYFITMNTFGLPKSGVNLTAGPFGVFSSDGTAYSGTVTSTGSYQVWNGNTWSAVSGPTSLGVFVKS